MLVRTIYVEKKSGFNVEAKSLKRDLVDNLGITAITNVRLINRYDVEGLTDEQYQAASQLVFSEPQVDNVFHEKIAIDAQDACFAVAYLPGQYDQRADSAAQCIQILTQNDRPRLQSAKLIALSGDLDAQTIGRIKDYVINPVEAHEISLEKPKTLVVNMVAPTTVETVNGFIGMDEQALNTLLGEMGFAMDLDDLKFCQSYFSEQEKRDPTLTEMRMIDTYWSDHCRHTTFMTELESVQAVKGAVADKIMAVFEDYLLSRADLYKGRDKKVCLMDLATIGAKYCKKNGLLDDIDESDEINACSIVAQVDVDGIMQEWLVMFKNETHNHPTEIEPFGGAATCLGGAIRDPLSGRTYVYQAMRVTGSGDPRTSVQDTLSGKLPQRKISTGAAAGYSAYGNQIGLATGHVTEVYHEGYVAKRMEIGAVVGAAPRSNVRRDKPQAGDVIILLGGRTGRDGCGGATGSSKAHTEQSLETCGAEVQKGNPPEERKLQRLFRNPDVTKLIKKCNDFGAGGISVAIGELAEGLCIQLDKVPKKYDGLDGTELAISESQERMAVVIAATDADNFILEAQKENLEATQVAVVTAVERLVMQWEGNTIVDIDRAFLNSNGAAKKTTVKVTNPTEQSFFTPKPMKKELKSAWLDMLSNLNVCSQKGLIERFDSTIGAGTVLMPFGGKTQQTPTQAMVAKIPVLQGETKTGTFMAYGFNPYLSEYSPFHGAVYAVVEAVTKVVATGGDYQKIRLTLQEYFERLGNDAEKWGKPFAALLGAYYAQKQLGLPAIGGKDSMSGTFKELTVPPTLVAFAIAVGDVSKAVSQEFKQSGSVVALIPIATDEEHLPNFEALKDNYNKLHALVNDGKLLATFAVTSGGVAEGISKMCFGNEIGFESNDSVQQEQLFTPQYGAIIVEVNAESDLAGINYQLLGQTLETPHIKVGDTTITLADALSAWTKPLEKTFPTQAKESFDVQPPSIEYTSAKKSDATIKVAKPRIFIPVFPGTNCEYDTAKAFERAGGIADVFVVCNLNAQAIEQSLAIMEQKIKQSQIIMIPGGFSGGDEPDGSGKFIATAFRNARIKQAVMQLLKQRDGLMLGICNGFQALVKLGLVPFGEIVDTDENCPTLTYNTLGRHISMMAHTKVTSNLSPWLQNVNVGDVHAIAMSHGEGRFVANDETLKQLIQNGQIATQYVDGLGNATYDIASNPNGSMYAIEGITSPDGRVLGKMGHSERIGQHVVQNVPGEKDQKLFEAGIQYFS
ncbi:MAG: phosphoribosylformylglycinamidine synthase [Hyphomonadaceae bacterium]|nr:phosphoribosylformylglycinamidine synthase [Clostridia bacterium]